MSGRAKCSVVDLDLDLDSEIHYLIFVCRAYLSWAALHTVNKWCRYIRIKNICLRNLGNMFLCSPDMMVGMLFMLDDVCFYEKFHIF